MTRLKRVRIGGGGGSRCGVLPAVVRYGIAETGISDDVMTLLF